MVYLRYIICSLYEVYCIWLLHSLLEFLIEINDDDDGDDDDDTFDLKKIWAQIDSRHIG